jgi:2-aminoadipate transaminase
MAAALENPNVLSLAAGFTDTTTLPVGEVGRAVAELENRKGPPEQLQYGTNLGRPRLRELLAARTAALDGLPARALPFAGTIIANGSQQILQLAAQVLCDAGDIVLVEQPTYFVFLEILSGLGVRAVGLPARIDGTLDRPAIAARLAQLRRSGDAARVKALYLQGYFANPSGLSRSEPEKNALAALLHDAGLLVPVLEDAAYRELWFERPWPARSTLALEAWSAFPRLYLGTLTKPFASGLKIGFAHATDLSWFERIAWLKGHADFGTTNFNQAILERVLEQGGLDAHLARIRPAYAKKMLRLHRALEAEGLRGLGWTWTPTAGGMTLWLRGPAGLDTSGSGPLWQAALHEGVLYVPGGLCLAEPEDAGCVRLSFGVLDGEALDEAARRFVRAAARAGVVQNPVA